MSVLGLAAGAAAVAFLLSQRPSPELESPAPPIEVPSSAFLLAFFVIEAFPIQIHFEAKRTACLSASSVWCSPFYLVSPGELLVAQLLGRQSQLGIVRRQRPLRLAFDLALFSFGSCIAIVVFHGFLLLGGAYGPAGWIGAVLGASAFAAVERLLVAGSRGSARLAL